MIVQWIHVSYLRRTSGTSVWSVYIFDLCHTSGMWVQSTQNSGLWRTSGIHSIPQGSEYRQFVFWFYGVHQGNKFSPLIFVINDIPQVCEFSPLMFQVHDILQHFSGAPQGCVFGELIFVINWCTSGAGFLSMFLVCAYLRDINLVQSNFDFPACLRDVCLVHLYFLFYSLP